MTASSCDWPRERTPDLAQQAASEAAMPARTASAAATPGLATSLSSLVTSSTLFQVAAGDHTGIDADL